VKKINQGKNIDHGGFTLLEVLVVLGIFSVISIVSFTMLSQYLDTTERLEEKMHSLQRLQRTFTLLEKDLRYVIDRDTRISTGETEPAIIVEYSAGLPGEILRLTVSRAGFESARAGTLRRVAWQLDNGSIYRSSWNTLDQSVDTEVPRVVLLRDIASVRIDQYIWSDDYGLQQYDSFGEEAAIPSGMRITVSTEDGREYVRLFDIVNGT
jgi:general secretion pathway protein J